MDATAFIPREYHNMLETMGRGDWLHPKPKGDGECLFDMDDNETKRLAVTLSNADYDRLKRLNNALENPAIIEMLSKFIAWGPKVFRVSAAQCEAMENVEINIDPTEYAQAYPVLAVEIPADYARKIGTPTTALCRYFADVGQIFILAGNLFNGYLGLGCYHFSSVGPGRPIEDNIRNNVFDARPDLSHNNAWRLYRIALNCNLLLTHYKTRLVNTPHREKLQRMAKRQNRDEAERGKRLLLGEPSLIQFEQNITFFDVERASGSGTGAPTGRTVKSHWRKGHWRRQPVGTGRTERKLIFIKAVLVHEDQLAVPTSQTSVTYKTKE